MNKEITIAYINYWQDPKNDNYFTKFIFNDKNIIIENNASSETAYITADGGGVFNSLSATTYYNLPTTISPTVNLFNYYNFI